ncbi:hypothetical protein ACFX19_028888 [Malus domestica]
MLCHSSLGTSCGLWLRKNQIGWLTIAADSLPSLRWYKPLATHMHPVSFRNFFRSQKSKREQGKQNPVHRQTTHRAIHHYSRVPDSSYTAKSHTAEAILSVIVTEKLPLEMDVNKCYDTNIGQDKKFRLSVGTKCTGHFISN